MRLFKHWRITSFQIIIAGFAAVILLGTLLLALPAASADGKSAGFSSALFTATSAVCVTGLVVRDTATAWSVFGQAVILLLIQIGGLGIVTVALMVSLASGRKIGLMQRSTMQNAINAHQVGGIVMLTVFILKFTLVMELAGAAAMAPVFIRDYGVSGGLWRAVFHSVSAFCNAGFDLTGGYRSMTVYSSNIVINLTVCCLIISGGLGFAVWHDIRTKRFSVSKYSLQTKIALTTSAILIVAGGVWFFLFETKELTGSERVFSSMFQSVTLRTAGFNSIDLTAVSGAGRILMIIFMLIGGSPSSTAGGMKTTTAAVLFASALSVFKRREDAVIMKRTIRKDAVVSASAILLIYVMLFIVCGMIISGIEALPVGDCLFETASAIGTVGLSMGITPGLSTGSRVLLIALMFFGRVGGLTLIYAAVSKNRSAAKFPNEMITVG